MSNYIIIADDDMDDRALMQEALDECGCIATVHYFANGVEVQEFLISVNEAPAFAILDLNMPRLNGLGTLKWMRNEFTHPNVPIVILTTSSNKMEERKCREAGANEFYLKPNSFDELVKTLYKVLTLYMSPPVGS